MLTNRSPLIALLVCLPLTAAAQVRDAGALLRGRIEALGQAGFAGMQDVPMPKAPSAVPAAPLSAPADETTQAIAALIDVVQKSGVESKSVGDTLRKLGVAFDGEFFLAKNVKGTDSATINLFSVTIARGKTDILLETVVKVDGKKQLRSYLISADGKLLGAAVTRKENGAYLAESVPLAEAESGYREQLDFWMRYYRANLKKP